MNFHNQQMCNKKIIIITLRCIVPKTNILRQKITFVKFQPQFLYFDDVDVRPDSASDLLRDERRRAAFSAAFSLANCAIIL